MEAVPTTPDWSGDIHGNPGQGPQKISCINLRRFYGKSGSISFRGYPRSEQRKGPFEPDMFAVISQWVGGSESPEFPIKQINL